MIAITKAEKEAVLAKYPDTHIVRTMKADSKRHRYYMTEDRKPMALVQELRKVGEVFTTEKKVDKKGRVNHRPKQKK